MIEINGKVVDIGSFPDGTMLIKHDPRPGHRADAFIADITWKYENDREFLALIYLVKHLRAHRIDKIYLTMPYIPNARQDRVKTSEDVFTLKYFAEVLNDLKLTRITVFDPHSTVSEALINNIQVCVPQYEVICVIRNLMEQDNQCDTPMIFYPDEGSMKRYHGLVNQPYAFGIKKRNWETGVIEGLDVAGDVDAIMGRDILIVDDICSRGGTFLHSAKKLKELGAKDIYLYVSHCENTILEGELLTSGLIKKVFTTDSIFTKEHELIEVLKW